MATENAKNVNTSKILNEEFSKQVSQVNFQLMSSGGFYSNISQDIKTSYNTEETIYHRNPDMSAYSFLLK